MHPVTEDALRDSFANCSKGEAKRIPMPRDLADLPWSELDFLGWRDHRALDRAYLVTPRGDGLIGVTLRSAASRKGFLKWNMCTLCFTAHPGGGVTLMTGRKAGDAGRQGNSAGLYLCSDLACSLYIRGAKTPALGGRIEEMLTTEEQIARMSEKLEEFLVRLGV